MALKQRLERLYLGDDSEATRFRYGLLGLDILTLLFLFVSSFFHGDPLIGYLDIAVGIYIASDYAARYYISRARVAFVLQPYNLIDVIVIASFLLPALGVHFAFLRVIRFLRLLRSYTVLAHLRDDFKFFRAHEDVLLSIVNLFIFLFVMTALVFELQVGHNEHIHNYLDALYFTVTALTTTGFGDVTLQGDSGKWLSIAIMIFGVSLFIRLIQTVFRPNKVRFSCPDCGLYLHDRDASHCKHCGRTLNIPDEGLI